MKKILFLTLSLIIALISACKLHAEWLVINSIPTGAEVTVNDVVVGISPLRLEGMSDQIIRITISSDLYGAFHIDHNFSANQSIFIDLEHQQEISEKQYWEERTISVVPETTTAVSSPAVVLISAVLKEIAQPMEIPSALRTESGDIIYNLSINNKGTITAIELISECSNEELKRYFEKWISTWIFDPAVLAGEPTESKTKIKISYAMETGEFVLPTYDLTLHTDVQAVEEDDVPEEIKSHAQSADIHYYSGNQVDRKAVVFKPPTPGDIPVDIINLKLSGIAEFMIFIDSEGNVDKVDVITGTENKGLDAYVIEMIKKSFWEPAIIDDKPVGYERQLTLDYNTAAIRFTFPDL